MRLDDAVKSLTSRAGVVRVKNAMNPLLWATTTVLPISLLAAYCFHEDLVLRYFLVGLGALPVLATLIVYFIFMFRDPDRLQSEEFVLRQHELVIYEKGTNAEVVDPTRDTPRVERHPRGFVDGGSQ